MNKPGLVKRKFIATFIFSILASIALIIHGIFIDANLGELKRASLEGFFLTFLVVFPSLLLLEWIFDLENKAEFKSVESRISRLERKKR